MPHPSDDDLILRFYGECSPEEADRLDAHLDACLSCGEAWRELSETLKLVDSARVPEPGPAFERLMWMRIAPALAGADRPNAAPSKTTWLNWRWLVPMAGTAAAVMVAAVALRPGTPASPRPDSPVPATSAANAAGDPNDANELRSRRVLLTALDDHFAQTEVLLVELLNAPDGSTPLAFERSTADDLISDGRLYRLTAQQTGEVRLVQVLDDLESVLVEVARSPERGARKDLKGLRTRIDDDGLLSKVRAVTHEIRERQQELITVTANENEGNL